MPMEYNPFTASTSGSAASAAGNQRLGQAIVSLLGMMGKGSSGNTAGVAPAGTTTDANYSYAPGVNPWAQPGGGTGFDIQQPKSGMSY